MNVSLTPHEAVAHVFRRIDGLTEKGLCDRCAILFMANEYNVSYHKLLARYLERNLDAEPG